MKYYITCDTLREAQIIDDKIGCCSSCHFDNNEFGYDMCHLKNALEHDCESGVCCNIYSVELSKKQWDDLITYLKEEEDLMKITD